MGQPQKEDVQAFDDRVQELVQYARDREGEERSALFSNLIEMFVTGNAPRRLDAREQLLDVLEALIPHVDGEVRRLTAEQLATSEDRPMDLVTRLVLDRASIVKSLLRKAPFEEDEFIDLIRATGREHHQELAARHDLPANVWIELARAAPNAPVSETPSTLALWEDDLGRRAELRKSKPKVELRTEDGKVALFKRQLEDESIIPSASDIAQSRAKETASEIVSVLSEEEMDELASGEPDAKWYNDLDDTPLEPQRDFEKSMDAYQQIVSSEMNIKDPCPGGWSWMSDAVGRVVALSPGAHALFGDYSLRLLGGEVADLVGLSGRRSHPVLKAIDRRGPIHDAPILLGEMVAGKRNWSLEAKPRFSLQGGRFEGYEGQMTPVTTADADRFAGMLKKDVVMRPRVSQEMKDSLRDLEQELRQAKSERDANLEREAEFAAAARGDFQQEAEPAMPSKGEASAHPVQPAEAVAGDALKLRELMAPPGQLTPAKSVAEAMPATPKSQRPKPARADEPAIQIKQVVRKPKSMRPVAGELPEKGADAEALRQRSLAMKDIEKAIEASQVSARMQEMDNGSANKNEGRKAGLEAPSFLRQRKSSKDKPELRGPTAAKSETSRQPANDTVADRTESAQRSVSDISAKRSQSSASGEGDTKKQVFARPKDAATRDRRRRKNMFATLSLLGEAGGRLKTTNRNSDPRSVLLDAEIVDSCTKTLLELLEEESFEADLKAPKTST